MSRLRHLIVVMLVALCWSVPVMATELEAIFAGEEILLSELVQYKRALAMDLARQLTNEDFSLFLASRLHSRNSASDLVPLLQDYCQIWDQDALTPTWAERVRALDRAICQAKGIAERVEFLLEVRLAVPEVMSKRWAEGEKVLVSYLPAGNEHSWKEIEAFDQNGAPVTLDARVMPKAPVLVVGLNARRDLQAGLSLMNEEFKKAGMQTEGTLERGEPLAVAKLNYIRLEDDQEPWISGDAEIYALINGIAPEAEKANVLALEMPYLADDKTNYYPNQVVVIWKNYRYLAANINIYEHDDSANYKEIVEKLIEGIGQVVPEYQYIFDIASKIIKLMPDSWFTNDDDYVDVYYTLEKDKTYTNYRGASNNATITLVPYIIQGQ